MLQKYGFVYNMSTLYNLLFNCNVQGLEHTKESSSYQL